MKDHPLFNAFLKPTVLATVPLSFGYFTGTICYTCVDTSILHSPLEETFASVVQQDWWITRKPHAKAQGKGVEQVEENNEIAFLLVYFLVSINTQMYFVVICRYELGNVGCCMRLKFIVDDYSCLPVKYKISYVTLSTKNIDDLNRKKT